jgi:hypothetical protein
MFKILFQYNKKPSHKLLISVNILKFKPSLNKNNYKNLKIYYLNPLKHLIIIQY